MEVHGCAAKRYIFRLTNMRWMVKILVLQPQVSFWQRRCGKAGSWILCSKQAGYHHRKPPGKACVWRIPVFFRCCGLPDFQYAGIYWNDGQLLITKAGRFLLQFPENSIIVITNKCIWSSGQGEIPYRWYSPRAARHDSVRFRSRQYSLDERR